ncbi:amidinotransferase [Myxococcota bacterium]|nr:amidinotransferase [Myxococcota bacterium]
MFDRFPARVITRASDLDFRPVDAPAREEPRRVLMASPTYYDVEYVINPHMEGNVGRVDRLLARQQWAALRAVYEGLGYPVEVIAGAPLLPDMVFTANQSFPARLPDGGRVVVLSIMRSARRQAEVPWFEAWYRGQGFQVARLDEFRISEFEGGGDALWHPGRGVIYGGHGFRSSIDAYGALSGLLGVPVLALRLNDPRFYHLDTCLAPLDVSTALFVEEAFDAEGRDLLAACFDRLIPVPIQEAERGLAANGHCPDGRHFVVQAGSVVTRERVQRAGFEVLEVDTSEFLKSGGSVYCLKTMTD